ncbi:unnamed protein product [Caenorhabditis angaria]|uniref:Uncharacterized protein n=1 Tax=Caenorhabditis angaria TaxID=860376 RepID=A0A9P1J4D6_9PELO|nr:unnamed protein product [Caenorhabditis angaria]
MSERIKSKNCDLIRAVFDVKIRDINISFHAFLQRIGDILDFETSEKVDRLLRRFRRAFCIIEQELDVLAFGFEVGCANDMFKSFEKIMEFLREMIVIELKTCTVLREYSEKQRAERLRLVNFNDQSQYDDEDTENRRP